MTNFFVAKEATDARDDEFCLMDFFEDDSKTGEAISSQLEVLSNKTLRATPKEEKSKKLLNKYKRPSNVEGLQVPLVNEQLWQQLQTQVKAQNSFMQQSKKNYAAAFVPTLKAMEQLRADGNTSLKELNGTLLKF